MAVYKFPEIIITVNAVKVPYTISLQRLIFLNVDFYTFTLTQSS